MKKDILQYLILGLLVFIAVSWVMKSLAWKAEFCGAMEGYFEGHEDKSRVISISFKSKIDPFKS